MKRFHVHVAVEDVPGSVRFYSTLFGIEPTVLKDDYAKWMLDDPRVNFAISTRAFGRGVDHLGLQVDDSAELAELEQRLRGAGATMVTECNTTCCYARSDKHWVTDPQGVAWETFHTLGTAPVYGSEPAATRFADPAPDTCFVEVEPAPVAAACCAPEAVATPAAACCMPKATATTTAACCG